MTITCENLTDAIIWLLRAFLAGSHNLLAKVTLHVWFSPFDDEFCFSRKSTKKYAQVQPKAKVLDQLVKIKSILWALVSPAMGDTSWLHVSMATAHLWEYLSWFWARIVKLKKSSFLLAAEVTRYRQPEVALSTEKMSDLPWLLQENWLWLFPANREESSTSRRQSGSGSSPNFWFMGSGICYSRYIPRLRPLGIFVLWSLGTFGLWEVDF